MFPDNIESHLYYTYGGSNKEYIAKMEKIDSNDEKWTVHAFYGPRGMAYNETMKAKEVPYAEAKKEFLKLLKSKVKKGYTTNISGAPSNPEYFEDEIANVLLVFKFEDILKTTPKAKRMAL